MAEVKFAPLSRFLNLSSNLTTFLNLNSNLTPKFYFKIAPIKYKFISHYPHRFSANYSFKTDRNIHGKKSKFNQIYAKQAGSQKSDLNLSLFGSNLSF
nr:hypothetical protein [uncultured Campylobacter sp.]